MKYSSFDILPNEILKTEKKILKNEFDEIEFEWSRLKFLIPINKIEEEDNEIQLNSSTCQLNFNLFKRIIEIYDKNTHFIQQLKDKHLGERYKLILHYSFLGIYILDIFQKYFSQIIHPNEELIKFIENLQILFNELTDETNYFYSKNQEIPFINDFLNYLQNSISKFPSVLYPFLDAKFLSYLYNYSTQEISIKNSSNDKFQSFEILLLLCYQALYDEQSNSNSFLFQYCSNYQTNLNLLIRILDEKIYFYLEELSLPDEISYEYLNKYLNHHQIIRQNDFEFLLNIFSQLFRIYRRDIIYCEKILSLFKFFLQNSYSIISKKFFLNQNWIHFKKLLDAFWQMTINKNILLNSQIRKLIIEIKQILLNDEEIFLDDIEKILNDSFYLVKIQGYKLCLNLFYEKNFCLKSSNEQKKILDYFLTKKNSLSILFLSYLLNISEFISYEIIFYLIKISLENKLLRNLIKYIIPKDRSIYLILQYYHQRLSSYEIKDFPWEFFNSIELYNSFIFSTYFISDRQQLYSIFSDIKSSIIEYFPQLQAYILLLLVKNYKQGEEILQVLEKMITKNEYNRLIKQNLTMIIFHILLTYLNDQENEFYDKWSPEPILPAYNWQIIQNTFDYIKQLVHGKTFGDILIKLTDIGEILLCLSSKIFSTNSIHEQLRLLNILSLFLNDILLNYLDNDYLHSILRDSTYILLRFIEKNSQKELNEKILNITCQILYQLSIKGLDFNSEIYLHYIPDIITTLINHDQYLTKERIEKILIQIYQFIKQNNDPIFIFISYTIQKL
jgi:hypothetical protein